MPLCDQQGRIPWEVAKCLLPHTEATYTAFIQCQCILHHLGLTALYIPLLSRVEILRKHRKNKWLDLQPFQPAQEPSTLDLLLLILTTIKENNVSIIMLHFSVHHAETHFLYHFEDQGVINTHTFCVFYEFKLEKIQHVFICSGFTIIIGLTRRAAVNGSTSG